MDTRAYVWLANNLDKYIYIGEGIKIKETISNLNITSESVRNSVTRAAMDIAYEEFLANFGNNILTYKTGLSRNNIASRYLDCYFIESAEGMVPIGFYREIRPVEAAIKVQQYIKDSQEVAGESETALLNDLTERHKNIKTQFEYMQKEKSPNKLKAFLGGLLSVLALVSAVLVLVKLNVLEPFFTGRIDLSGIWMFKNAYLGREVVFLVILSMIITVFGVVILGVIFTIREMFLIKSKKITKDISENMDEYIQKLKDESEESIYQCKYLHDAAGKSQSVKVEKHVAVSHIGSLVRLVEKAEKFVLKTRTQRRGNDPVLLYSLAGCILVMALFNGPVNLNFENKEKPVTEVETRVEVATEVVVVESVTEESTYVEKGEYFYGTGNRYLPVDSCETWESAAESAKDEGGNLVSINSQSEFIHLCLMAEEAGLNGFWAGLCAEEIDWDEAVWVDGNGIDFVNWDYMENVKQEDDEYLLVYKGEDSDWYFRSVGNNGAEEYENADNYNNIGYIIEFEGSYE